MQWVMDPQIWLVLATLTALEIVMGIDNIIFIPVLVARLPAAQQDRCLKIGLLMAMMARIALLFGISLILQLRAPLFTVFVEMLNLKIRKRRA
jgi:predicted tellurium resistance membrane protein TerC